MPVCILAIAIHAAGILFASETAAIPVTSEEPAPAAIEFEAGRLLTELSNRIDPDRTFDRLYGYQCSAEWIDRGISKEEAFDRGYHKKTTE